jgi:hypothetical protein
MYYLIAYNSITFANRIKKHFASDGDFIGILHTPKELSKGGCSYSVKVKPEKIKQVLDASNRLVINQRVYKQTGDGNYVEVESYDISG